MAHKKGGASTANGRDSAGRRLGVKKSGGARVIPGNIIIRQRGTAVHPGENVGIYDGKIGELRREKNEVKEVSGGVEFGMSFDKYNDLKEGDRVECYEVQEIKAQL